MIALAYNRIVRPHSHSSLVSRRHTQEKGAEVFEELLIDADWSINNFNWQWLSCTAHFYQYFRCYSPVAFGKKTDP